MIAYDGTDYHGWQRQPMDRAHAAARGVDYDETNPPQLPTVQGLVEDAVRDVLREPTIHLLGASRTDAGVHAQGQIAAFTTEPDEAVGVGWPAERGTETLARALNARLPRDILVREAALVHDAFDPISDAVSKEYTYTIAHGPERPLWQRRFAFHTWYALDAARMDEAARHLEGEHDFVSFAQINHGRATTVRTIHACRVEAPAADARSPHFDDPAPLVRVRVSGSGFLYNMVRIIAGTLMEVGRGKIEPGDVPAMIAARDRAAAGPTLPPTGLRLEWIEHANPPSADR